MAKCIIRPPKGYEPGSMKNEFKQLKHGFVNIITYPNDVEVVTIYMNDETTVLSSKPLIKIDENTYQVPD